MYPYWMVQAYRCETFEEAHALAKVLAERTDREIHIMEKLDQWTAFYTILTVQPPEE